MRAHLGEHLFHDGLRLVGGGAEKGNEPVHDGRILPARAGPRKDSRALPG